MHDALQESKAGSNTENNGKEAHSTAAWAVCTLSGELAAPFSNLAAGLQPSL
jgi:hypothetical protein